jgi:uncharacterized protein YqfA (UPF0365 family)
VMDYYQLKNVMADTDMRRSISKLGEQDQPEDPHK